MSSIPPDKPLFWIGSSLKDLRDFPEQVKDEIGFALYEVQRGLTPRSAKALKGFGGASVLEIVEDFRTDAYRAVYTVQFAYVVYVLHAFQKKSKKGVETPKLKTTKKKADVIPSSGNVFADMGLPDAEDRLLKAQLALKIQQLIGQKGMTQTEVAPFLGLDQPKVSNLMRGRLAGFSVERLFGILNRLGHNVEVYVSEEEYEPEETYTSLVT